MKHLGPLALLLFIPLACKAEAEDVDWANLVVAIGVGTEYVPTDWVTDFCAEENERVAEGELRCISNSIIFKVRFEGIKVLWGHLPKRTRYIALDAHAPLRRPRDPPPTLLVLRVAKAGLTADTGIKYYAAEYSRFDPEACVSAKLPTLTGSLSKRVRYMGESNGSHCYSLQ